VITDADFEHVEAAFRPGGLVLDAEWKPHAAESYGRDPER
jgi:hypothetical protein